MTSEQENPGLVGLREEHEFVEPPVQPRGIDFQGRADEPVAAPE